MANFRSRERMAGSPQARTERVLPPPLDGPPDMAVFGPMAIRGPCDLPLGRRRPSRSWPFDRTLASCLR